MSTGAQLSEVILSHSINVVVAYPVNSASSENHVFEGLLDLPIEVCWHLISSSET